MTRRVRRHTPLAAYRKKRDFQATPEPAGTAAAATRPSRRRRALRFVIQKHAASHLHFDLRLELEGVMKSWAVPKGPSYDPSVRRLAMEVEDHPIEYNSFEGTIPEGEYGAGTVMIWDRGTYEPDTAGPRGGRGDGAREIRDGYDAGDLKIRLRGTRLVGGWVLVRMRRAGSRSQWLLIKHRDEFASATTDVVADAVTSVTTGRTMEEIAAGKKRVRRARAKTRR